MVRRLLAAGVRRDHVSSTSACRSHAGAGGPWTALTTTTGMAEIDQRGDGEALSTAQVFLRNTAVRCREQRRWSSSPRRPPSSSSRRPGCGQSSDASERRSSASERRWPTPVEGHGSRIVGHNGLEVAVGELDLQLAKAPRSRRSRHGRRAKQPPAEPAIAGAIPTMKSAAGAPQRVALVTHRHCSAPAGLSTLGAGCRA